MSVLKLSNVSMGQGMVNYVQVRVRQLRLKLFLEDIEFRTLSCG